MTAMTGPAVLFSTSPIAFADDAQAVHDAA